MGSVQVTTGVVAQYCLRGGDMGSVQVTTGVVAQYCLFERGRHGDCSGYNRCSGSVLSV